MEIIDVHIHTTYDPEGVPSFRQFSLQELLTEMKRNNVEKAVSITSSENYEHPTPMRLEKAINQKSKTSKLAFIAGINPFKVGKNEYRATEKALSEKLFIGLKIYPGYTP